MSRSRIKDQIFEQKMLLVPLSLGKSQDVTSSVPGRRGGWGGQRTIYLFSVII